MKNSSQIFFDETKTRYRLFKRFILLIFFLLLLVIGSVYVSLSYWPIASERSLSHPISIGRQDNQKVMSGYSQINNQEIIKSLIRRSHLQTGNNQIDGGDSEIYAYHVERDPASFNSLKENIDLIDGLLLEWLTLSDDGLEVIAKFEMTRTHNFLHYVKRKPKLYAHLNSYITSQGQRSGEHMDRLIHDEVYREEVLEKLVTFTKHHELDGVSINIEDISAESREGMLTFLESLSARLFTEANGAGLIVQLPLVDADIPHRSIANVSDKVLYMIHDQHGAETEPGPVAGMPWYERHLESLISGRNQDKYIIGLGNYGYDRKGETTLPPTPQSRQETMLALSESDSGMVFDYYTMSPHFSYTGADGKTHHIWYSDAVTFYNQFALGKKYGVKNFGIRRLGTEDPGIWTILADKETLGPATLKKLEGLRSGYVAQQYGKGVLFRYRDSYLTGERTLEYDSETDLILDQKVITAPLPYMREGFPAGTGKQILLTFDDGPSEYTSRILDILKEHQIQAVFFIIGGEARKYPGLIKRMYREGHIIGNHTYFHGVVGETPVQQFILDLRASERVIEALTNHSTILFRAPYNAIDLDTNNPLEAQNNLVLDKLGYYHFDLDVDPYDRTNPGTEEIVQSVFEKAEHGNIVLLHDGGGDRTQTLEALPEIITGLRNRGYDIVSAEEALKLSRKEIMQPLHMKEQILAAVNEGVLRLTLYGQYLIYYAFIIGIVLGLLRLTIIIFLSVYHSFVSKKRVYVPGYAPAVSVLVPAYNEDKVVVDTVENLLKSTYENFEIVVIDDGSKDNTYGVLVEHFAEHKKVKVLTKENGGKSSALNYGIDHASGDILIVQDADTYFDRHAIGNLVRHFHNPKVGAVAGNVKVGNVYNLLGLCQALEYMTSQNLDRRALDMRNCITVVPGAIGARRKSAVVAAGGFKSDTLAEDCDLTVTLLSGGRRILHEQHAVGWTEAPESLRSFVKQRFRWRFGILQVIRKHKRMLFNLRQLGLGRFALPNLFLFQLLFPLLAPLLDVIGFVYLSQMILGMAGVHQFVSYADTEMIKIYLTFLLLDISTTLLTVFFEKERNIKIPASLPIQRLLYRIIMTRLGIKVLYRAATGKGAGWNKLQRTGSVDIKKLSKEKTDS